MSKAEGLAKSVHQRLLNLRDKTREDFNVLLVRYAIERLLYRLSRSEVANQFVLKGAMLFVAWMSQVRRPTRDLMAAAQSGPVSAIPSSPR